MIKLKWRGVSLAFLSCLVFSGALPPPVMADNKHRPLRVIPRPTPSAAPAGCTLTAIVYDSEKNQTTFSYDCPTPAQPHNRLTETKPGNYFN